jgi:acyl carrier protein
MSSTPDLSTVQDGVFAEVRGLLELGDDAPIRADQLLLDDLGLDSFDLIELIYRLERRFSLEISEGTLVGMARGDLSEDSFFDDPYLTPLGRARVLELLHDTPPARFPDAIHRSTVPLYATVGAFARIVHRLLGGTT